MKLILGLFAAMLWLVPFSIVADYGLLDWQWWLMMLGVVTYATARSALDRYG